MDNQDHTTHCEPNSDHSEQNTSSQKQSAFRKGIDDASKKAKECAPKVKHELESLLGELAYGAGFVPGFVGTLVKEIMPDNVTAELQRGVAKGQENAREFAQKCKTSASHSDAPLAPETSASPA